MLLLARSAMIDLPTFALFNPSMEGKYSSSSSSSSSYSSSENCPDSLGQNSDRMRKICGSLYGVSTDRPQWEQYGPSTDFLSTGPVCRRVQTCADVHPWFADVCIMLAPMDHSMELQPGPLGSLEGTASSTGPQLQPAPLESMVVHRVPARSSNQSRPAGDCCCWPGRR